MHISYYDNADDACHQISYEARLGGYGWGILGQKWEKGAIEKKFFLEKFLYGLKPFCKLFKKFA